MNNLLPNAQNFLEGMSQEELSHWFQQGVSTYYDRKVAAGDKANHLECLSGAFDKMSLTLGNSQHRTTLSEEFKDIYPQFSKELQDKFQLVLGESVKTILTQGGSIQSIDDLIELALELQYEGMADILADLLPNIQDTELKISIYLHTVFFFEENKNLDSVSRLIQVCFDDPDLPYEVFLKLIVARVRMGTSDILDDIRRLNTEKIRLAVQAINKYPEGKNRFSDDLKAACENAKIQVADIVGIIDPNTTS